MLEQQFIQWSGTIDPLKKEIPIPVCDSIPLQFFGSYVILDDIVPSQYNNYGGRIDLIRENGDVIQIDIAQTIISGYFNGVDPQYICYKLRELSPYLAPMECFRLRMTGYYTGHEAGDEDVEQILAYSNLLRYVSNEDGYLSGLSYYCNEEQFGFPFTKQKQTKSYMRLSLPIRISKPQYKQADKIYENRNGEQIVLYATINKEYEGETDYIPEEWHEKIVTALSCDEVYINGERVTKSDSYEIDQDNYTYSDCGIRLTRATFKVKTNVTQRNSNC